MLHQARQRDFPVRDEEILLVVQRYLAEREGVEINAETQLESVGIDSFSLLELVVFLERTFGCKVAPGNLNRETTRTPRALASTFAATLNHQARS